MDLNTFIITVFCLIDDRLTDLGRLRARGPTPTLCDSEVLTIEVVGEFLGLDEDTELFAYFRRHYAHFFPNLLRVHRTTFTRQAANLWKAKEHLWQELLARTPHDPTFALADSLPLPACLFARAYRSVVASAGKQPSAWTRSAQADLLRLSSTREGSLAGRHHSPVQSSGQHS